MSDFNDEIINNNNSSDDSEDIVSFIRSPKHFGRMNNPTSSVCIKGPCGDEMEFYLVINDGIIEEVKFYTDGCISTIACGEVAARLAQGKSINEVLDISPGKVKQILKELPQTHSHCSILAVCTLHRAVADFLLKNKF